MKKLFAVLLLIAAGNTLLTAGNGELPPQAFLALARSRCSMQSSFADLRGLATHLRKNQGGASAYPIRFIIRFNSKTVEAAITLPNKEKHYYQQDMQSGKQQISGNVKSQDSLLNKLGFRVEDMALSFLNYTVKQELPSETVKTVKCRVLYLLSPEGEPVKAWISEEYLFPLKAEFFACNSSINSKPERSLEITGFKKINNYYVATDIALFSSTYRTRIAFSDCVVLKADDPQGDRVFKSVKNGDD